VKITVACVALGVAVVLFVRGASSDSAAPRPGRFMYDLSEQKVYEATRDAFAPDKGIGGEPDDGVEAIMVVCPQCGESSRRIAYLQTHTPDFKARHETAAASAGVIDGLTRAYIAENTLVRTLEGNTWYPTSTPEGSAVVRDARRHCPTHGCWEAVVRP